MSPSARTIAVTTINCTQANVTLYVDGSHPFVMVIQVELQLTKPDRYHRITFRPLIRAQYEVHAVRSAS